MLRLIVKIAAFLYLLSILILVYLKLDAINLADEAFLNKEKCPFCFGLSLCDELAPSADTYRRYDFSFSDQQQEGLNTHFFTWLLNIKNIFFIKDNFSNKNMVLKKLAHESELVDFDAKEISCYDHGEKSKYGQCLAEFFMLNKNTLSKQRITSQLLKEYSVYLEIEVTKCFTDRMLDLFYMNTLESQQNGTDYMDENIMFLSTLKINPEPIILQVLENVKSLLEK